MALPIELYVTDAAGNPINGAKVFHYQAGTLSPKAVFTTPALNVALPQGFELTNGYGVYFLGTGAYRRRVTDANGVELTRYALDNISDEPVSGTAPTSTGVRKERFIATEGQTVFNLLGGNYTQGNNSLRVYVDGGKLPGDEYAETSPTSFTLITPVRAGVKVEAEVGTAVTTGFSAAQASFIPAGSGAVATDVQTKLRELPSVLDKGADPTGAADSTTAFNNSTAVCVIPQGTYRTNTTPTGPDRAIVLGAQFTGSNPYDAWLPAFGSSTMEVISDGGQHNAVIGVVRNTLPPATLGFPTGVTGYARNDNAGNTAFGIYAEGRQFANSGCVVGAELDSFNHGAAPTNTTTPDRSIGTAQQLPNAITIGAGGTANSWCATHYTREGSLPQRFLYGAIFDADAITEAAIVIEAGATTGPTIPVLVKHKASSIAMQLQTVGTAAPDNAVLQIVDPAASAVFGVRQNGRLAFQSGITQSTVGAAGGASALPATPAGYLRFLVGSTQFVIPYYAAS